jgi:hypothetical protein
MISSVDLERFYKDKRVEGSCPSCGEANWEIGNPPNSTTEWALSSVRTDGSAVMPAPSIPAIVLVCGNCYTLRAHAYLGVKKWIDENPIKMGKE